MPKRHWRAEKVPNDPQDRWIVVSDDGLAKGVWYPDEDSAQEQADWQNEKESAYEYSLSGIVLVCESGHAYQGIADWVGKPCPARECGKPLSGGRTRGEA